MTEPLDDSYLTWLHSQFVSPRLKNPARTYWSMARQLYSKEFVWLVPNDDNRIEDGKDLRHEFVEAYEIRNPDRGWLDLPCSCLEMLLGLSRRLSFEADGEPRDWFWHLLGNLDLQSYNDKNYNEMAKEMIDSRLDKVIWRNYAPDGQGGLFPLKHPREDQRDVELWYQLAAYLGELF